MVETSIERFEKVIRFEETERPPLGYPFFGGGKWVLNELGVNFDDVYYSADGIAKAQMTAKELFGHDNVMSPWGCLTVEAEAFGCKIQRKRDGYPQIVEKGSKIRKRLEEFRHPKPTQKW